MLVGSKQLILMFIVLFLIFSFGIGLVVWIYLDSKNTGKVSLAPPAFTFLPYYIDQDSGWSVLYGSFQNQD